jgi:hypothetical protein
MTLNVPAFGEAIACVIAVADVAGAAPQSAQAGPGIAAESRSYVESESLSHTAAPVTLVERQKITSDDGVTDEQFGWAVAVDREFALVAAPNATIGDNAGQGAIYVFTRSGGQWQQTAKLVADDGGEADSFGISVALSGSTAIIGAPNNDTFRGAVYVFRYANGSWMQTQKLVANDGTEFNQFGWSVALSGMTALIGSTSATVGDTASQGAVYAFDDAGNDWIESQKFSSDDGASGDAFGWSVALDGDRAVAGANFANVEGNEFQGAAYAFARKASLWVQTQKLTASNGDDFDFFGSAVALEGGEALIGAEGAATDGNPFSNQGVVYRYSNSTVAWSETQILAAGDGESTDAFGHSIALRHGRALIGATGVTVDGISTAGAAYVFRSTGGRFAEVDTLTPSDPVELGSYGWSGAILGKSYLVGAYTTTAGGHERQGAVYLYGPPATR